MILIMRRVIFLKCLNRYKEILSERINLKHAQNDVLLHLSSNKFRNYDYFYFKEN